MKAVTYRFNLQNGPHYSVIMDKEEFEAILEEAIGLGVLDPAGLGQAKEKGIVICFRTERTKELCERYGVNEDGTVSFAVRGLAARMGIDRESYPGTLVHGPGGSKDG